MCDKIILQLYVYNLIIIITLNVKFNKLTTDLTAPLIATASLVAKSPVSLKFKYH